MEYFLAIVIGLVVLCPVIYALCYIRGILWSISIHSLIKNLDRSYGLKLTIIEDKRSSK